MEHHRFDKPLSFGEILDVTFRNIKENFSKLFLITFIFMAPIELLQGIAKMFSGVSLLRASNSGEGISSLLNNFQQATMQSTMFDTIYLLLYAFISGPMAYASLIIATDQIRKKEPVNILSAIKRAFSRYWALLGGGLVFGLIMTALFIGITVIIIAYLAFSGIEVGSLAGLGFHLVVMIVLSISIFCTLIYFLTRWSFFFAAIVFEKVSPGLGKSWRLTRGNFWRLIGLYIVLSILLLIIMAIFELAVYYFLGDSVLAYLLLSLIAMPILMTSYLAYAVIYFDLRVRNDALDLKGMIETYPDNINLSNSVDAVETKPEG